tara:strand:+ start:216 stop:509 length:294 start_codon:yes stop_codon:yes gene_type:complete
MKVRSIVRAAFRVDELVEQFQNVDVPDGVLVTGSIEEVNEKYDDRWLIGEAENRLLLIEDQLLGIDPEHIEDWKILSRDKRQLENFIKKYKLERKKL